MQIDDQVLKRLKFCGITLIKEVFNKYGKIKNSLVKCPVYFPYAVMPVSM